MLLRAINLAAAFALIASRGFAAEPARFTGNCNGSETVQANSGPIKTVPYSLTSVVIDLAAKTWCWRSCSAAESRSIADVASTPVNLTDIDSDSIIRHTTINLGSGAFSDYFRLTTKGTASLDVITRVAATCAPATAKGPRVRVR